MHYFISDLHLGAGYIKDRRAHEKRVVAFLERIADDATELYLLGDILDYWFEYRHVVPRGHVRFLGALASLADRGVKIVWITGNHDVWLRDYLRDEIGITVYYGATELEIGGSRFLLSHGDDVGRQPAMYRFTRWCFYNPVCQWLYAGVHPRWTAPVALGWSKQNRVARDPSDTERHLERCVANHVEYAEGYLRQHPDVRYFVFGHLHLARVTQLSTGAELVHLGDWIDQDTYATFDGTSLQLHSRRSD